MDDQSINLNVSEDEYQTLYYALICYKNWHDTDAKMTWFNQDKKNKHLKVIAEALALLDKLSYASDLARKRGL